MPSEDAGLIDIWISKFLRLCNRYNIIVRVLEGTPSHDRQQSDRFRIINDIHYANDNKTAVDLLYIKTLSIEHIDKYNIDVLYVPDEWNHETSDTLIEVKELLASKNIKQVDYAVMHGGFDYQMGSVIKNNIKHDSKEYLDLVKGLIFIGHIHQHSNCDRIYAGGSFDRLAHGEEETKGFLTATVNKDYSHEIVFVENTTARKFITVKCPYEDAELNLKRIDKHVKKLPSESFVRIETNKANAIVNNIDTLKRKWPFFHWSVLAKDKDIKDDTDIFSEDIIYTPMVIDKETIIPLVIDRISKLNINPDILDRSSMHLKELI